ncbi:Histone-lysine N-methyltransferase, H3 lysine-79 specific [Daldinia childiae]|uniref:Histone-lysine N-methyltransferase, H3 lysine-79 specific n=1 Tax=Daldinia childiae TaxID=326645 RepID=UPI0014463146|nr:Histone-lysine N-methyltransferase, H3 lysine-79 specific [Daldinia childiae]KAF3059422.1 Histone-lysine N-methyltransferase, H3 lysine-79 specific [Daldinia childiae]
MGIFNQKSRLKAAPQEIRVEKVVVPTKPRPSLTVNPPRVSSSHYSASPRLSPNPRLSRTKSASPYPSSSDEKRAIIRKRKAIASTPRDSPAFGNDSESEDDDSDPFRKRLRRSESRSVDLNRKLRHKKAFGDEIRDPRIIHAADIASVATKCPPIQGAKPEEVAIELQYPSRCKRERYELVWQKDKIDAIKDILLVVEHVAETYLTDDEAKPFIDHNASFRRQMERAISEKYRDVPVFRAALKNYNDKLLELVENGTIAKNIEQQHHLPPSLVSFILTQVYDRTVAPKVEMLTKYEMGSDNVYGELLHPFITKLLVEQTKMTSDQVFIDLGSGVGNVVLQAALEIGCRSYGCEMMENACNLAEAQEKEFRSRCHLWGVAHGRVHLERGDFRTNAKILEKLKEADVILVNNKAFTSTLNDALINMFLDLKKGCKIISLKSFVHENKTAINDVANSILDVQHYRYHENWVSWAAAEGDYYISIRK